MVQAVDFERVFAKPARRTDKYFTILYLCNDGDVARLGLAISKKRARRAVDRNRIKRLVRESFRQHQDELQGCDFIVLAQNATASADNPTLFKALQNHWRQLSKQ
ncbi:MAG: ribonuclease P protein component [Gammaproteobacteria bacterium]